MTQEEHHKEKTFREEYMEMLKIFDVDFDEQYLFEFYEWLFLMSSQRDFAEVMHSVATKLSSLRDFAKTILRIATTILSSLRDFAINKN